MQEKHARTESPMRPLELDTSGVAQRLCDKFRNKQKKHKGQTNHTATQSHKIERPFRKRAERNIRNKTEHFF